MKLALALFLAAFSAHAADPHCQPMNTPLPDQKGQLCIYPGKKNADVLYYFHGHGSKAEVWGDEGFWGEQLRAYWQAHGEAQPTVVAVSLGDTWLLSPKTGAPMGIDTLDYFTTKIIPNVEAKLGGLKGRRLLVGDSMGGFNAIQLSMKTNLFARVAALCAPMGDGTVGPFSSETDIDAYIRRSTAFKSGHHTFDELETTYFGIKILVSQFWTESEWPASDPIELARSQSGARHSKLYLAAGFYDQYLTYEGNVAFASILAKSGTSVEWRPQWGDHCAIDIPSLAEFLVKP